MAIHQYDVVKVVMIRDDRFATRKPAYQRHPEVDDIGTVVEVYSNPTGYEVECCAAHDGITTWLEPMYPGEIETILQPTSPPA